MALRHEELLQETSSSEEESGDFEDFTDSSSVSSDSGDYRLSLEESEEEGEDSAAPGDAAGGRLTFQRVWQEELQLLTQHRELRREQQRQRHAARACCAQPMAHRITSEVTSHLQQQHQQNLHERSRFSVAFSGGGVRAAAFQAGVLWQLAESGNMRDVDYIAAVSGGSYIAAAFASHVVEAGQPKQSETLYSWYRGIVARTLCRMQTNTPYLARDLGKNPWRRPTDGSSWLPRVFDIPILLVLVLINTAVTPFFYLIFILVPGVELFDMVVGGDLRWMYCDSNIQTGSFSLYHPKTFFGWSYWPVTLFLSCTLLGLALVFWSLEKLPLKEKQSSSPKLHSRNKRNIHCWLFLKSSYFVMTRIVMILVMWYTVTLVAINYRIQHSEQGSGTDRLCLCHHFSMRVANQTLQNDYYCADTYFNHFAPYYANPDWNNSGKKNACHRPKPQARASENVNGSRGIWEQCGGQSYIGDSACKPGLKCVFMTRWYSQCLQAPEDLPPVLLDMDVQAVDHPLQTLVLCWLGFFFLALLLVPFFPKLYGFVLGIVGPLAVFLIVLALVDVRVFGALTGRLEESQGLQRLTRAILVLDVVIMPFQHTARGLCHRVYRKSLHKAFFANGDDSTWKKLGESPFCPFLLVTATVNDFMRPGDSSPLSEICQSPLHIGGTKTGWMVMPSHRKLSRSVALSGAAIDAFVLGKNDHIKYRFWLEMMSLSMGDFMTFDRREKDGRRSSRMFRVMIRIPVIVVGELFYGLMLVGDVSNHASRCDVARFSFDTALLVAMLAILVSFFAWIPVLDPILHCLPIRGIHLLTRFYHRAESPPSLVCVTDGGLLDNTGAMQLLRRQCLRILLVYGGNDAKGKFKWLRKVIDAAGSERLCTFHHPQDPALDLREVFQDFNEDRSQEFIHLKIRYGWRSRGGRERPEGDLFVVTNRLPASCSLQPVEPLLTFEEVAMGNPMTLGAGDLEGMLQSDLGGCCCDCCHSHGCNFGPKFPNTHQMNQCLTPQLFNSLCRLGKRASKEAIASVSKPPHRRPGTRVASPADIQDEDLYYL